VIDSKNCSLGTKAARKNTGRIYSQMQHVHETERHHSFKGLFLFGGLTAALAWTLYIVWVGLVGLADKLR
jgi:hypothetical protein